MVTRPSTHEPEAGGLYKLNASKGYTVNSRPAQVLLITIIIVGVAVHAYATVPS